MSREGRSGRRAGRKSAARAREVRASPFRFRGARCRRECRSADLLPAARAGGSCVYAPAAPAGDRARAVPLVLPEAALRLLARLRHRNVHLQSTAVRLMPAPAVRTPLAALLA